MKHISQLRKQSYFTELKFRGQTSDGCTVCVVVQGLPQHAVILDVRTRWNTFYLMVKRFVEQYPAIPGSVIRPKAEKVNGKWQVLIIDFKINQDIIKKMKPGDSNRQSMLVISSRMMTTERPKTLSGSWRSCIPQSSVCRLRRVPQQGRSSQY